MTQDTSADAPTMPAEIRELLGPAPVLTTEDAKRYERILRNFAQCVRPRDFIEWMWVLDLTDHRWEIERLRRFKHQLVEEAHKANVERTNAVTEASFVAEVWGLCATARSVLSGLPLEPALKTEREQKLNADIEDLTTKTEKQLAKLNRAPTSADFARVADEWILPYERVEKLLRSAENAFNGVLEQIDHHREGLGLRLRKVCDEIIDGEFEEAPRPLQEGELPLPTLSSALVEATPPSGKPSVELAAGQLRNEPATAPRVPAVLPTGAAIPRGKPVPSVAPTKAPGVERKSFEVDQNSRFGVPGGHGQDGGGARGAEVDGAPSLRREPSALDAAVHRALGLSSSNPSTSLEQTLGLPPPTDAARRRT